MKVSDATILMLPGRAPLDDGHWLPRWTGRLSTALAVPDPGDLDALAQGRGQANDNARAAPSALDHDPLRALIEGAPGPVVAVAYREGIEQIVGLAEQAPVHGAFLVAPREGSAIEKRDDPLPFPTVLVASRDDPACAFERADAMGARWGSLVVDAGDAGALDGASGRGPWPEGLMVFAKFLANLKADA